MEQLQGFIDPNHQDYVRKLNHSLYGLKQAPHEWFSRLISFLASLGFIGSKADSSLFVKFTGTTKLYVFIYADDIIMTGFYSSLVDKVILALGREFLVRDLEWLNYFLGVQVTPIINGVVLSQQKDIEDLLYKSDMGKCNPYLTPMGTTLNLSKKMGTILSNGDQF